MEYLGVFLLSVAIVIGVFAGFWWLITSHGETLVGCFVGFIVISVILIISYFVFAFLGVHVFNL